MGHERNSESSGGCVVIAIVAVLFLTVVGGFAIAGVWFLRASAHEAALVAMEQKALASEAAARAMAVQANLVTELVGIKQSVTIKIDSEGKMRLEDEPTPLADLRLG